MWETVVPGDMAAPEGDNSQDTDQADFQGMDPVGSLGMCLADYQGMGQADSLLVGTLLGETLEEDHLEINRK